MVCTSTYHYYYYYYPVSHFETESHILRLQMGSTTFKLGIIKLT